MECRVGGGKVLQVCKRFSVRQRFLCLFYQCQSVLAAILSGGEVCLPFFPFRKVLMFVLLVVSIIADMSDIVNFVGFSVVPVLTLSVVCEIIRMFLKVETKENNETPCHYFHNVHRCHIEHTCPLTVNSIRTVG